MNQEHDPLRLHVGVLLLSVLLLACSSQPTPTTMPLEFEGHTVLLNDDFSTGNSSWAQFNTEEGAAYIEQGELYLEDHGRGIGIYTHLVDQRWDDAVVNVRLRQVEGAQDNWMGVICRQQDEENYYLFAISADGYYLLLKVVDGFLTPLAGPTLDEAIQPGRTTNQLEAECVGDTLSLQVNDQLLTTQTDPQFTAGNIALFADAVAPGGVTTVAFDVFTVSAP